MTASMREDQVVALLASIRMAEEAALIAGEARIAQIDAVMRGFATATPRCPACGSEDLANASTHGGNAGDRICKRCEHPFTLETPTS